MILILAFYYMVKFCQYHLQSVVMQGMIPWGTGLQSEPGFTGHPNSTLTTLPTSSSTKHESDPGYVVLKHIS